MKKKQINPLFMGLIMIVLGVILVVYSGQAMATILRITAVGFLVFGTVGIVGFFLGKDDDKKSIPKLFVYAIEVLAGLIALINPQFIMDIYPIAMGPAWNCDYMQSFLYAQCADHCDRRCACL